MALSYQAETSDGTLKRVILGIDFFDTSDIYVTQGDRPLSTPADYQWDGRTAINLTEVVPAGVLLMVRRKTDNTVTRLKFSQGAPFVRENIDAQNKQFLFLAQEASEGAFGDLYNNLNMHNFRIFNLAEPVDDKDAATKGWAVRTFSGIYSEYLALCKAEADRAVAAANHAADSERIAKDAASTSTANAIQTGQDAVVSAAARDVAERKAVEAAISAAASEASAVRAENAADAITGSILDGGPCDLSSGVYPPPLEIKGKKYSTVWAVTVGGTIDDIVYLAGDGLRYTVNGDYYFRVDVTGEVKAQIRAHAEKPDAHPMSGVAGLNAALEDKASVAELNSAITAHEAKQGAHTPQNVGADPAGTAESTVRQHKLESNAHEIRNISGVVGPMSSGAVIERGSNSLGDYVKFADGTMICQARVITSTGPTEVTDIDIPCRYPAEFVSAFVSLSFDLTGYSVSAGVLGRTGVVANYRDRTTTGCKVSYTCLSGKFIANATRESMLTAIGRWK